MRASKDFHMGHRTRSYIGAVITCCVYSVDALIFIYQRTELDNFLRKLKFLMFKDGFFVGIGKERMPGDEYRWKGMQ